MKNILLLGGLAVALAIVFVGLKAPTNRPVDASPPDRETPAPPPTTLASPAPDPELQAARNELRAALADLNASRQTIADFSARLATLENQLARMTETVTALQESNRSRSLDSAGPQPPRRSWGPEQATGPPDTLEAGDLPTAWAARTSDGGEEWLRLEYAATVPAAAVHVYESYNPGAITKVTAFQEDGREVTLWEGVEPEAAAPVVRMFTAPFPARVNAVKIYLDTRRVSGWNEIDAVELVGQDGRRQWATTATASSSFADR